MASQHFDFTTQQGFPQTPSDALTVVRNSEAFPENADGSTVKQILANELMMTTAGLRVWEQRTNVVLDSINFTAWSSRGVPVIQDRNQLAPDGTVTASTITVGTVSVFDMFRVFADLTPSTNHEASFWIKRVDTTGLLRAQRTSSSLGQTGEWDIDLSALPDDWTRLTENHPAVTVNQNFKSGTSGLSGLFFFSVDGTNKTFNLWGVQMEEGATVSPYVSTAGVAVTRFKDVITQPTSQLGFGPNDGMIVIDLVTPALPIALDTTLFDINNGVDNNQSLRIVATPTDFRLINISPGQTIVAVLTGITNSTRHKIALGWKPNGEFNVSVDGTAIQKFGSDARTNFTPQAVFNLGSDVSGALQLNSTINSLTSYPDYSDALLQLRSTDRKRAIVTNYYRRQGNG